MSQEDVELVRRAFEGRLDDAAEGFWDPEVEYVEDPRWPGASTYTGRAAVLECFRSYTEALGSDLTVIVERVIDAGDRQVPFVRVRGEAPSSGAPHEHVWAYIVEVRDGRIVHFRAYYEPDEALEAAGVSP